jgi:hypothetical protein
MHAYNVTRLVLCRPALAGLQDIPIKIKLFLRKNLASKSWHSCQKIGAKVKVKVGAIVSALGPRW